MVDVTPLIPADRQVIDSYSSGRFRISGQLFHGPVLVFPDRALPWTVNLPAELTVAAFTAVQEARPAVEILLIGTGARMTLVPPAIRRALRDGGISVDAMDTGAACRTYNVLLAEGRRVAAALLPV